MLSRGFFGLSVVVLGACSQGPVTLVSPPTPPAKSSFQTEDAQALSKKLESSGRLEATQSSTLQRDAAVVREKDGTRHFIKNGKTLSRMRAPKDSETSLQYWRHQFQGETQIESPLARNAGQAVHGQALLELRAPKRGLAVIYDPETDRVVEVIEYAPAHD